MRLQNALDTLLSSATTYVEYGAGETTLFSATKTNLKEIHSVESDSGWIRDLKAKLAQDGSSARVQFHHKEMDTAYMSWGHPGPAATEAQKRAYSDPLLSLTPDVVLIDGRFRVACALKAHGWLSDTATLVFDDFWIRPQYHLILDFYDLVQRIDTIAILKRKSGVVVPPALIREYELVAD